MSPASGWLRMLMGTVAVTILMVAHINVLSAQETIDEVVRRMEKDKPELPELGRLRVPGLKEGVVEEKPRLPYVVPETRPRVTLDRKVDPDQYVMGPGDEITVYFWGQLDDKMLLKVTPEGKLLVPTIGELAASDRTLTELKAEVTAHARKKYPKVEVSVVLNELRAFRVFVTGEVENPGSVIALAVDRVADVIEEADGTTETASTRNLRIRRRSEILSADIERYYRTGDLQYNPYVRMGDVIYVPPREQVVTLSGSVFVPGQYELREDDSIQTLIELAGGLRPDARTDAVEVARFVDGSSAPETMVIDLSQYMDSDQEFPLRSDDLIFIRPIPEWRVSRLARVTGEVKHPGTYLVGKEGVPLQDLVVQAGGFTNEASLVDAQVIRGAAYFRADPEFDRLKTMEAADMSREEYAYFKAQSREQKGAVAVDFREQFTDHNPRREVMVRDADLVFVPKKRATVKVTGQVEHPGLVTHEPGKSADYYMGLAGGYSWNADKKRVRVIKGATGLWLSKSKARALAPGDAIFVPEKTEREWWTFFREATSVFAELATIIILARTVAGY